MVDAPTLRAEIERLDQVWQAMPRGTPAEKAASQAFYGGQIFPLIREEFALREAARVTQAYDLAVMTAGGSPEALVLSLSALRPAKIFFLHTAWQQSLDGVDQVVSALRLKPSQFDKAEVDPDDTVDTYAGVKRAIEWAGNPARVVVDISGGKKSMSVAAGLAAYVAGADIAYVDNSQFLQAFGKPKPGSEFLVFLSHPYTVFGDLARKEAENLYRGHHYGSASRIFERLAHDVPSMVDYGLLRLLSEAYYCWDRLDLPSASEKMERLVDELHRRKVLEPHLVLMPAAALLADQAAILKRLQRNTSRLADRKGLDLAFLREDHLSRDLIFMLHANALRREAEQRYDMAALLLYRVLEMMAQRRLALLGIDTAAPDFRRLPKPFDLDQWQRAVKHCANARDERELPKRLALQDSYIVLYIAGDALVDGLNWGKMMNAITARNRSVFAHGFRFIEPVQYAAFKRVVEDRLQAYCAAEGLDMDRTMDTYRFVTLFSDEGNAQ